MVFATGHMLDPSSSQRLTLRCRNKPELTRRTTLCLLHVNSNIHVFQCEVQLFCITKTGLKFSLFSILILKFYFCKISTWSMAVRLLLKHNSLPLHSLIDLLPFSNYLLSLPRLFWIPILSFIMLTNPFKSNISNLIYKSTISTNLHIYI